MDELSPPGAPRYEQLADILRRRIFDGSWPADASGPLLGSQYGVSQTAVQKAFEILERHGLLRMMHGRRTTVAARQAWRVELEARLPDDGGARARAAVAAARALETAAAGQPAVSDASAGASGAGLALAMTVESASMGGALTAAVEIAEVVLGPAPIVVLSAREA